MKLSLRQAAEQAGVSKSTILRAVQSGRLSAERNDDGGYAIDPSEVMRVYADKTMKRASNDAKGQDATPDNTGMLQAQIDGLKAQVELMRESLDDLKTQREGWQKQAEASQRLLANNKTSRGWFRLGR